MLTYRAARLFQYRTTAITASRTASGNPASATKVRSALTWSRMAIQAIELTMQFSFVSDISVIGS
jgi:hypothetical protein